MVEWFIPDGPRDQMMAVEFLRDKAEPNVLKGTPLAEKQTARYIEKLNALYAAFSAAGDKIRGACPHSEQLEEVTQYRCNHPFLNSNVCFFPTCPLKS